MSYESDLKQYKSLERKLEREDVNACFEAATFFDGLLDTYNKSAGQVFDDLKRVEFGRTTKGVSTYDLSGLERARRKRAQEPKTRTSPRVSPYDLSGLARSRR